MNIHGGDIYDKKINIDFSVNTNPLGMPENVKKAMPENVSCIEKYPDIYSRELIGKIAVFERTKKENIIVSNGAIELIYSVVNTVRPENALVFTPTFTEYERALKKVGCNVVHYEKNCELKDTDIIFICNPNNPTGNYLEKEEMKKIIDFAEKNNIFLFIDECFLPFTEGGCSALRISDYNKMFVLKAFTKIYSMPGVRLGYGVMNNKEFIEKLFNNSPPWQVSSIAQKLGIVALDNDKYIKDTLKLIREEKEYLYNQLKSLGFSVFETRANFILFKTNKDIYNPLIERGILIRECTDFGLKNCYRISIKKHSDNSELIKNLKEVCKNG